jgi:hypothetical protein
MFDADVAVLDVNLSGQKSFPIADALVARSVPFAFSTGYHKQPANRLPGLSGIAEAV